MTHTVHVMPLDDLKEHTETDECECKPEIKYDGEGGKVVIHNAWDRREFLEMWMEEKEDNVQ